MDFFTVAWLTLAILVLIVELIAALNNRSNDTLTQYVYKIFSIKEKGKLWWLRRSLLLAIMVTLTLHFMGVF